MNELRRDREARSEPTFLRFRVPSRSAGRLRTRLSLALFWLSFAGHAAGADVELPVPGSAGWQELLFPKIERHTAYRPRDGFVEAEGDCSASALYHTATEIDLRKTPRLSWEWRVEQAIAAHDERVKAGDDFAARVYVTFRFDPDRASLWERVQNKVGATLYGADLPGSALTYVWSTREPAGSRWDNPYTESAKMISLGKGRLDDWKREIVNIADDYRSFHGQDAPPLLIVALMTDTDNTCSRARASFRRFRFLPAE